MKHGKRYVEAAKLVDRSVQYHANEAISLLKKTAVAKFDETIELHIRTGLDGRHADQQIRGAVVLPHGTGKTVKILVFAKGPKADEALAAGADYVGAEELIPRIQNDGWLDFDVKVEYRLDKTNLVHVPVGKASFSEQQLLENFQSIMDAINKAKPSTVKGAYLKSVVLTSTMGPGIRLNVAKITG